jgi:pantothenate synthetase
MVETNNQKQTNQETKYLQIWTFKQYAKSQRYQYLHNKERQKETILRLKRELQNIKERIQDDKETKFCLSKEAIESLK